MFLTDLDNTNISEEQQNKLLDTLKEIASPYVSTYTAMRMAKLNKSRFYQLIKEGKLPQGEHRQGHNEVEFNKYLLEKAISELKRSSK